LTKFANGDFDNKLWEKHVQSMRGNVALMISRKDDQKIIFPFNLNSIKTSLLRAYAVGVCEKNPASIPSIVLDCNVNRPLDVQLAMYFGKVHYIAPKKTENKKDLWSFITDVIALPGEMASMSARDAIYPLYMDTVPWDQKIAYKFGVGAKRFANVSLIIGLPLLGWHLTSLLAKSASEFFSHLVLGSFSAIGDQFQNRISKIKSDPSKIREAIEATLFENMMGRDSFIRAISPILVSFIMLRGAKVHNMPKSAIIVLHGPPGTGKSLAVNLISSVITGRAVDPRLYLNAAALSKIDLMEYFKVGSIPWLIIRLCRQ
jgi:hypothetical protein